jgi:hypothetical protein
MQTGFHKPVVCADDKIYDKMVLEGDQQES